MSPVLAIGILTTFISAVLAYLVLARYFSRGKGLHLLLWGIGLVFYAISGLCEIILAFGWSDPAFRLWYWTGALMIPPVLGQGTAHLLIRKPYIANILTLVVAVLGITSLFWICSIQLDPTKFNPNGDIGTFLTESYRAILPQSPIRRVLSPVMNGYGTLLLAGGAIYSALLFFRKQIMPNRVLGNLLIAIGAIIPAIGGTFIKTAETMPQLSEIGSVIKYVGILGGVILLFIGFQLAVSGVHQPSTS